MILSVNYDIIGERPDSFEAMVRMAKAAGFDGIEASIVQIEQYGVEAAKELLSQTQMKLTAVPLPWNPIQADAQAHQQALEALAHQAEVMCALDCKLCYTFVRSCSHDLAYEENWAFHVARFAPIVALLQTYGIKLALEFIGPKTSRNSRKYPFLYTAEELLKLCSELGENCGLLFDTWHWFTGANNRDVFENLHGADRIFLLHVSDAPFGEVETLQDKPRALAGETGRVDFPFVIGTLKEHGYHGPIVSESFSPKIKECACLEEKLSLAYSTLKQILA